MLIISHADFLTGESVCVGWSVVAVRSWLVFIDGRVCSASTSNVLYIVVFCIDLYLFTHEFVWCFIFTCCSFSSKTEDLVVGGGGKT